MNRTHQFYARPSYVGGSFPVYSGSRRHRGGSIFGATKPFFIPDAGTIKKVAEFLPNAIKKAADRQTNEYVSGVTQDVMNGESIADSLKERAGKLLTKGVKTLTRMAGKAIANKRRRPPPRRRPKRVS